MKISKRKLIKLIKESLLNETVTQRGLFKTLQSLVDEHGNEFFCVKGSNASIGRRDFGGVQHGYVAYVAGNIGDIEMVKREKPIMLAVLNPVTGQPVIDPKTGDVKKFPYFPVSKHQAQGEMKATGRPYAVFYGEGDNDYMITVRPNIIEDARALGLKVQTVGDGQGLWVRMQDWERLMMPRAARRFGSLYIRLEDEIAKVLKANQNISLEYSHRDAVEGVKRALGL